jgi:deoxyribonuclease-4
MPLERPPVGPHVRRLGAHLPLAAGMVKAADRAAEIGADVIQIFSDNPTAWRRRSAPPRELTAFRQRLDTLGIGPLAIHASYLVNLAGPDTDFHEKSVAVLTHELMTAQLYGAAFLNVHIGSHRGTGTRAGVERIASTVLRAFEAVGGAAPDPILALENSAGGGFGLGATVGELALVLGAIEARGIPRERVKLCLDTAHLWGAGHRISDPDELDRLVEELDGQIGLGRLAMIHLNDSRSELGSHADRHQHIGAGQIGATGLRAVLCHPRLRDVPCYLETPGMDEGYDAVNMLRCRDLMAGRELSELPGDALSMAGSRSRSGPAPESGDETGEERFRPNASEGRKPKPRLKSKSGPNAKGRAKPKES